jgi:hypothetical protein
MALVSLQQFLEETAGFFSLEPVKEDTFTAKHRSVLEEF